MLIHQFKFPSKKFIFLPDIISEDSLDTLFNEYQEIVNLAAGRKIVLLIGAIDKRKGVLNLLNSTKRLDDTRFYFVIAGKNPSTKLIKKVLALKNVKIVANPSSQKMEELIANAQINILPSFSSAGIKLKLLNALNNGRYCIANNETLSGSGLDSLCVIANTADEFIIAIGKYFTIEFENDVIEQRKQVLAKKFSNLANAELLKQYLFG
jgi:glycosyltransferase involved in cell wall biosynthesis